MIAATDRSDVASTPRSNHADRDQLQPVVRDGDHPPPTRRIGVGRGRGHGGDGANGRDQECTQPRAPALGGDTVPGPLTGNTVSLQSGSYLAAPSTVEVDSKWGGSKTFFSREGRFTLRCRGVVDQ